MSGVGNANTRINLSDVSRVCGSRENLWCDLNELFDLTNSHIINHCIMISFTFTSFFQHIGITLITSTISTSMLCFLKAALSAEYQGSSSAAFTLKNRAEYAQCTPSQFS